MTLVVLALSACGGGGGGGDGSGGDEGQAKAKEQAKSRPLPEYQLTPLSSGTTYHSEEFQPSLSFRVGEGWSTSELKETPDKLGITPGGTSLLVFRNVQEVFKPSETGGLPPTEEAPKDMVGWLQHHPYLQTDKPQQATVGGVKGVQFDYVVAEDAPVEEVPTFKYSDGFTAAASKGYTYRAIVLEDVKGETVTIGISSPDTEFDEDLLKSQKVLDTVKWGDS